MATTDCKDHHDIIKCIMEVITHRCWLNHVSEMGPWPQWIKRSRHQHAIDSCYWPDCLLLITFYVTELMTGEVMVQYNIILCAAHQWCTFVRWFISLWPSDSIWRHKSRSKLAQPWQHGTKPLLEPMFTYHQSCSLVFTCNLCSEITLLELLTHLLGTNELHKFYHKVWGIISRFLK